VINFLIDENLSVSLVQVAKAYGYAAHHVVHLKRAGITDAKVLELAIEFDAAILTNNGKDFRKLVGKVDIHPGLIIFLPSVRIVEQERLFLALLKYLKRRDDLINRVIEVDIACEIREFAMPD
jgi:predicted nuclease of predicted toxin-antitoxin system